MESHLRHDGLQKARPPEEAKIQKREGASASEDSAGDRPTLKLEFRDLPVPDLPPKGSAN